MKLGGKAAKKAKQAKKDVSIDATEVEGSTGVTEADRKSVKSLNVPKVHAASKSVRE